MQKITVTELKELEEKSIKLGAKPMNIYCEALKNFIDSHQATDEEIKKVIDTLKSSKNKIEWKGKIYITKVKSLDFGKLSKKKLNAILVQINYGVKKINGKTTLCVPVP